MLRCKGLRCGLNKSSFYDLSHTDPMHMRYHHVLERLVAYSCAYSLFYEVRVLYTAVTNDDKII